MEPFSLTSPAFGQNELIPPKYTCDGEQLSPPLRITGTPGGTQALVLLMDDPDIPKFAKEKYGIEVFDHWTVFNIPPETAEIAEGEMVGELGLTSAGKAEYVGPCPPPEHEPREHRYVFTLYALTDLLSFSTVPTKQQVLDAIGPLVIEKTELIGRYSRK